LRESYALVLFCLTVIDSSQQNNNKSQIFFDELFVGNITDELYFDDEIELRSMMKEIKQLSRQRKQLLNVNPLTYFKKYQRLSPMLYKLSLVVFSAPGTQVSVERTYNMLRILLTPSRNRLSCRTTSEILLINLNRDLLHYVDFEHMKINQSSSNNI
jgi:hAT family C-terminal dimerisation region